jgi:hypothetical protein
MQIASKNHKNRFQKSNFKNPKHVQVLSFFRRNKKANQTKNNQPTFCVQQQHFNTCAFLGTNKKASATNPISHAFQIPKNINVHKFA